MVTFLNGPAAGQILQLQRAPMLLRVTRDKLGDGAFDALDQLDDTPKGTEELWAYRCVENHGMVHISYTRKGRRCGGFYAHAKYALVEQQPEEKIMRNTARWRQWCIEASKKVREQ